MDQNLPKPIDENEAKQKEYYAFIKDSANKGVYFKDAQDWYFFRYVNPLCDRTIVFFVAIIAAISLYFLVKIIDKAFPLVEKVPIVIRATDGSLYQPFIKSLRSKDSKDRETVDNSVLKYLLSVYISDREGFDYRKSRIEDVNKKFNRIKNNSSFSEYRNFQSFMSKDNPDSPIHNFGQNIYRTVAIQSINFIKPEIKGYYGKLSGFFLNKNPNEAEIMFVTITHEFAGSGIDKKISENYLAKIKFDFSGVSRDSKVKAINFSIANYKLFKIK